MFIHPWWGFIPRDMIYSHRLATSLTIHCKRHEKGKGNINKAERMLKITICQLNATSYSCFLQATVRYSHLYVGTLFPLVPLQNPLDSGERSPSTVDSCLLSKRCLSKFFEEYSSWICHNLCFLLGSLP